MLILSQVRVSLPSVTTRNRPVFRESFKKHLLGDHLGNNVYPIGVSDVFVGVNGKKFNRLTWYHNLKNTLKVLSPVLLGTAPCLLTLAALQPLAGVFLILLSQ